MKVKQVHLGRMFSRQFIYLIASADVKHVTEGKFGDEQESFHSNEIMGVCRLSYYVLRRLFICICAHASLTLYACKPPPAILHVL